MRRREYPPFTWNFTSRDHDSPAARFHADVAECVWRLHRRPLRRASLLLRLAAWPAVSAVQAIKNARAHANDIAEANRRGATAPRSPLRAVIEQLALAWGHAVPPGVYWRYGLWSPRRRRDVDQLILRHETKLDGAFRHLRAPGAGRALSEKRRFWDRCRERGLPAPTHVLEARHGTIEWLQEIALPDVDLFVKPNRSRGGQGAVVFTSLGRGRFRRSGRESVLSASELLSRLARWSMRRTVLVQRRLATHPMLVDVSPSALPTVRVLTVRDEDGRPETVAAAFRMGVRDRVVDNFHAGGIAADVDLATGTLGEAIGLAPFSPRRALHPATGAPIAGRPLPFFADVIALVKRAHSEFSELAVVGWDVGITPDGPVLVEGNAGPDVDIHQIASGRPLGRTRFADLVAFHLERRPRGRRAPRPIRFSGA